MLELGFVCEKRQNSYDLISRQTSMKMDTQITLAPPRILHLLPFKIGPYCMLSLFGQNKQTNDHSPSITFLKQTKKQMIKSLKENAQRYLAPLQLWSKR